MQTLGLSSKPQAADSIFKRLFWPSIESQYDVDLLGQQGFYVCIVVGTLSLLLLAVSAPLVGLFEAVVFYLAGCGVRERSVAAASMAFALYFANFAGGFLAGTSGNPLIQLVVLMLLFANVRATLLSRRWSALPPDETDFTPEERSSSTILDRFANRLPGKIWPIGRYLFFPLAGLLLGLGIVGIIAMRRSTQTHRVTPSVETLDAK